MAALSGFAFILFHKLPSAEEVASGSSAGSAAGEAAAKTIGGVSAGTIAVVAIASCCSYFRHIRRRSNNSHSAPATPTPSTPSPAPEPEIETYEYGIVIDIPGVAAYSTEDLQQQELRVRLQQELRVRLHKNYGKRNKNNRDCNKNYR